MDLKEHCSNYLGMRAKNRNLSDPMRLYSRRRVYSFNFGLQSDHFDLIEADKFQQTFEKFRSSKPQVFTLFNLHTVRPDTAMSISFEMRNIKQITSSECHNLINNGSMVAT